MLALEDAPMSFFELLRPSGDDASFLVFIEHS